MIGPNFDYVVVLQAVIAAVIMWRAFFERVLWDRWGFVLLAACAAMMTLRRVTARNDLYLTADNIVLPTMISWLMLASALCFAAEMVRRLSQIPEQHRNPQSTWPHRYFWPFLLMFCMVSVDWLPATSPSAWDGHNVNLLMPEKVRAEALNGNNKLAAIEQLRWDASVHIDTLYLIASGKGVEAIVARQKLAALHTRLEHHDDHR